MSEDCDCDYDDGYDEQLAEERGYIAALDAVLEHIDKYLDAWYHRKIRGYVCKLAREKDKDWVDKVGPEYSEDE